MRSKNDYAIKVKNISKVFQVPHEKRGTLKSYFLNPFRRIKKQKFEALDNVSFEVKKGEFLGIIGRNGSGKSTLLKMVAGIYTPNEGKVSVNGKIIPFLELGVGFNPELSGRENIFLNGTILGMSKKYLEEKFDEIVEFAEIRDFIDLPLKNYSSGMQVRLAFAIAIQTDGDIYLLDEILAVGDANFQVKSLEALKKLKALNKTIIYVSHDENSIKEHCSKVLLLEKGKKVYYGDVQVALAKYNKQNLKQRDSEVKDINYSKSSKVSTDRRWGSGEIVIENVDLLDSKDKEKHTFKYEEKLSIRIDYKVLSKIDRKNVNVGVGIYNQQDDYVFGVNTQMDDVKVSKDKGRIFLEFESIKLLNNNYFLNIVIFPDKEKQAYDWIGRVKEFEVTGAPIYRGIVNIKHNWK